ncbi:hypothetical protein ACFOHT_00540, partial [Massilia oculi]
GPGRAPSGSPGGPVQLQSAQGLRTARAGALCHQPGFGRGIKLDFAASDVQLDEPGHVERLRQVFRAANARGMAIVMDVRASRALGRPYGAAQARVLLEQVLPSAPDVPVQVSYLAGNGPGFGDTPAREALAVLAEAAARGDPRMRQVWFDVAAVVQADLPADEARRLVRRLRQLGWTGCCTVRIRAATARRRTGGRPSCACR